MTASLVEPRAGPVPPGTGMSWDRAAAASAAAPRYAAEKFSPPVVTNVVRRPRLHPPGTERLAAPVTAGRGRRGVGQDDLRGVLARGGRAGPDVGVGEPRRSRRRPARLLVRRRDRADAGRAGAGGRGVAPGRRGRRRGGRPAAAWWRPRSASRRVPIALVLDNLHEIRSPQVHSGLVRLVAAAAAEPGAARHDAPGPTLAAAPTPPRRAGGGGAGGRPRLPRRGGRRAVHASWASA